MSEATIEQQLKLIQEKKELVAALCAKLQEVEVSINSQRQDIKRIDKKQTTVDLAISRCNIKLRANQLQTKVLFEQIKFQPPPPIESPTVYLKEVVRLQSKLVALPVFYDPVNIALQTSAVQAALVKKQQENIVLQEILENSITNLQSREKKSQDAEKMWKETIVLSESHCKKWYDQLAAAKQEYDKMEQKCKVARNQLKEIERETERVQCGLDRLRSRC